MIGKVWITGWPAGNYLGTVTMEIVIGELNFQIKKMRLVNVRGKKVLAFPSQKINGKWQDFISPMNQATREVFTLAAVKEYEKRRTNETDELHELLEPL